MNLAERYFNAVEVKALIVKTLNDMFLDDTEQGLTWAQNDKVLIASHPTTANKGIAILGAKGTGGASASQFPLTINKTDAKSMSYVQVKSGTSVGRNFYFFRNVANSSNELFDAGYSLAPQVSALSITGTANVGQTLTINYLYEGKGFAEGTSTYQWKRNGVNIVGATSSTYVMQVDDVKTQITCEVTPVNIMGLSGIPSTSPQVHGGVNIYPLFQFTLLDGDGDGLADDGANPPTTETVNSTAVPANATPSLVSAGTEAHTYNAQRFTCATGTTLVWTLRNVAGGIPTGKKVRVYFKLSKPNSKTFTCKLEGNIDFVNVAFSTSTNLASATLQQFEGENQSGTTKHIQFRMNSAAVGETFTISEIEVYYLN